MRLMKILFLVVHFLLGFYLINSSLDLYPMYDVISDYEDLFVFAGGVLVIVGGINLARLMRRRKSA